MSRQVQLSSLKERVPVAYSVTSDESRWNVPVEDSFLEEKIILSIYLPNSFPAVAPIITVYPHIKHELVNEKTGLFEGHPSLHTWGFGSDLGVVISDIYKLFQAYVQLNRSIGIADEVASASFNNIKCSLKEDRIPYSELMSTFSSLGKKINNTTNSTQIPPPARFSKLEESSEAELEFYSSNPEYLNSIITADSEYVKQRENLKALAEQNVIDGKKAMKLKEKYDALRIEGEVIEKKIATAFDDFSNVKAKFDLCAKRFTLKDIESNLTASAAKCDKLSDDILQRFRSKLISLSEFKTSYIEIRKEHHKYLALRDKLIFNASSEKSA